MVRDRVVSDVAVGAEMRCCGQNVSMSVRGSLDVKIMLTTCAVLGPTLISKAVISRA